MNENQYSSYEDDREIDLIDMMFYLLKKWRTFLLAIVFGVILGAGLYVVKNHQQQVAQAEKEAELLKNDDENMFDEKEYNISKDSKANMEIAYQYRQMYNKQLEYNQKSIIMQLDPNAVYTGELKYYISAGNNTGLLSTLYQNVLNDEKVLEELKKASGFHCDTQYIKELIDSWTADENAASININNSEGTDSVNAVVKNSFVTYKVISTSQDSCEQMLQVICEKVDELQTECEEKYGSYSVVEVSDNVSLVTDNTYLNMQRNNVDQLNNYLYAVKNAEDSFSDEENKYYNKKYLAKEYAEKANTEEEKELLLKEIQLEPVNKVKWLVIGVILLVMIWTIYYVVRYFLDPRVKTISELQSGYCLPIVGHMKMKESQSKGIDRILDQFYQSMKEQADTYEYIVQAINAMGEKNMVLCGNVEIPEIRIVMEKLVSDCKYLKMGNYISKDIDSLKKGKELEREILVISVGKTRYDEISRELLSCKLQNINIVGALAVENN